MRIHWPLSDKEETTTRATTGRNPFNLFLYFIQMHFLFSPIHPSEIVSKKPNLTWNIGTTTTTILNESDAQNGRKEIPAGEYWPFFKVPHFHNIQI
jgi:hypothetical protein